VSIYAADQTRLRTLHDHQAWAFRRWPKRPVSPAPAMCGAATNTAPASGVHALRVCFYLIANS
jgi:hypothetical protein